MSVMFVKYTQVKCYEIITRLLSCNLQKSETTNAPIKYHVTVEKAVKSGIMYFLLCRVMCYISSISWYYLMKVIYILLLLLSYY